jgi:hypothetical protein
MRSTPLETRKQMIKKKTEDFTEGTSRILQVRAVSRIEEQTNETATENYNESTAS